MKEQLTDQEYDLLIKDLSARAPYGCYIQFPKSKVFGEFEDTIQKLSLENLRRIAINLKYAVCLPYLRPFDSMTDEEYKTYEYFFDENGSMDCSVDVYVDWLLEHHFDFRGLIPMGLAIESPKEMYNFNKQN